MTYAKILHAAVLVLLSIRVFQAYVQYAPWDIWAAIGMSGVFYVLIYGIFIYVYSVFSTIQDFTKLILSQHQERMQTLADLRTEQAELAESVEQRTVHADLERGREWEHIRQQLATTIDVSTKAADASAQASVTAAEVAATVVAEHVNGKMITKDEFETKLTDLFRTARPERRRDDA